MGCCLGLLRCVAGCCLAVTQCDCLLILFKIKRVDRLYGNKFSAYADGELMVFRQINAKIGGAVIIQISPFPLSLITDNPTSDRGGDNTANHKLLYPNVLIG